MPLQLGIILSSLGILLLGAELFTNAVEWVGKRFRLSEGAVGSVLAAVGTALPETLIPVVAILFRQGDTGHEIGIGAILGAPFMLATLAFFIIGVTLLLCRRKAVCARLDVNVEVIGRDLAFFLAVYSLALAAALTDAYGWKRFFAAVMVMAYCLYIWLVFTRGGQSAGGLKVDPLFFCRAKMPPPTGLAISQLVFALSLIIFGAYIFVGGIAAAAKILGIPALVMALIVAPVATELPEKFNSIIWIFRGKDTLALGNITGAMVFQSSLIPVLGILFTPWKLTGVALLSAVLAILSAALVLRQIKSQRALTPFVFLWGGVFYSGFLLAVYLGL
ncbi:MAG: sodium:calcium antiporter [Bacillota bacterium]